MDITKAENLIMLDIDNKVTALLAQKPDDKKFLEFHDMELLCDFAENIWATQCGCVPQQIKGVSAVAKAVLDPDWTRKVSLCKDALALLGGVGGVAAIIGAIGTALGLGAGVIATITAFFVGISWTGPLAVAALGAVAVALAGYLAFNDIPAQMMSERALRALKDGTKESLPEVWKEYGSKWKD